MLTAPPSPPSAASRRWGSSLSCSYPLDGVSSLRNPSGLRTLSNDSTLPPGHPAPGLESLSEQA